MSDVEFLPLALQSHGSCVEGASVLSYPGVESLARERGVPPEALLNHWLTDVHSYKASCAPYWTPVQREWVTGGGAKQRSVTESGGGATPSPLELQRKASADAFQRMEQGDPFMDHIAQLRLDRDRGIVVENDVRLEHWPQPFGDTPPVDPRMLNMTVPRSPRGHVEALDLDTSATSPNVYVKHAPANLTEIGRDPHRFLSLLCPGIGAPGPNGISEAMKEKLPHIQDRANESGDENRPATRSPGKPNKYQATVMAHIMKTWEPGTSPKAGEAPPQGGGLFHEQQEHSSGHNEGSPLTTSPARTTTRASDVSVQLACMGGVFTKHTLNFKPLMPDAHMPSNRIPNWRCEELEAMAAGLEPQRGRASWRRASQREGIKPPPMIRQPSGKA